MCIAEQLAPLQDGDVEEVAVRGNPELVVPERHAHLVPRAVEGQIP